MTANQSQMMQDLYSRYYSDVINSDDDTSWGNASDEAAAFQLVIWEISHENFSDTSDLASMKSELSITLGALVVTDTFSNDVLTTANAMINALGSGGWNNYGALLGATNATNQDLLIVVPSPRHRRSCRSWSGRYATPSSLSPEPSSGLRLRRKSLSQCSFENGQPPRLAVLSFCDLERPGRGGAKASGAPPLRYP